MPRTTIQFFAVVAAALGVLAFIAGLLFGTAASLGPAGIALGIWLCAGYLWLIDPDTDNPYFF